MHAFADLLRRNPDYARLWLAQAVSMAGDWFTLVALSVVVSAKSQGSGLFISLSVLVGIIPYATIGPWSGVLADRFDRIRLMVASDLARVVLLLLLVAAARGQSLIPVLVLSFLHFTIATVFEPARSALVPNLVDDRDLVLAATLGSITWSAMAAIGALLAGAAVALLGTTGALLIDSATFLLSAMLLFTIRSRKPPMPAAANRYAVGIGAAARWLRARPVTLAALLVKTVNGLAVFDTFLILYGTQVFVLGNQGSLSTGLLWAAIGVGSVTGPLALARLNDGSLARMRRLIAACSCCIALGLGILAGAPWLAVAVFGAFIRAFGGGGNWTFSTIILQKSVPDEIRGRVFALDLAAAHLMAGASSLVAGLAIDRVGLRPVVLAAALLTMIPAAMWTAALGWMDRREARGH